jgi:hypothetical protein
MYELPGVHEPAGYSQDFYFVRHEDGEWAAGIYERGQYKVIERFADEDAACRYVYRKLTDKLPEANALSTDEARQISDDSDEIQRRAWESFERAQPDEMR